MISAPMSLYLCVPLPVKLMLVWFHDFCFYEPLLLCASCASKNYALMILWLLLLWASVTMCLCALCASNLLLLWLYDYSSDEPLFKCGTVLRVPVKLVLLLFIYDFWFHESLLLSLLNPFGDDACVPVFPWSFNIYIDTGPGASCEPMYLWITQVI